MITMDDKHDASERMDLTVEGQAVLRPEPGASPSDGAGAEEERNREAADLVEESND